MTLEQTQEVNTSEVLDANAESNTEENSSIESTNVLEENAETKSELDLSGYVPKDEFEKIRSTNQRLLEEAKREKAKRQKAQEEKMIAEGRKDELIESLRKEKEDMKEKNMMHVISSAVEAEARRRGCDDWDQLLEVGDTSMVEFDPDSETVSGIANFFDKHQNESKYSKFFVQPKQTLTETRTPSMKVEADYKKDPIGYLRAVKKNNPEKYNEAFLKMKSENLIG